MRRNANAAIPPRLLFDVMGTLVYDPFFREVPHFFQMNFEELLRSKHPTAWVEFESGERTEAEFLDNFFADGRRYDQAAFKRLMHRSYRWLEGMRELLEELSESHPIHLVSNYPVWYRTVDERVGLSKLAEWTFVSCHTKLRKPDARAYRFVLEALQCRAEECLFIDDSTPNCDAARTLGMDVISFRDAPSLRQALNQRGLLV